MHPESQHLEYKRELTDALEREVVGFLNSREGGRILLGVDDEGKILGLVDPDGDQLKIKNSMCLQQHGDITSIECMVDQLHRHQRDITGGPVRENGIVEHHLHAGSS